MRQPIPLIGGPLELDGMEVPDTCQVAIIVEDVEFVQHVYWAVNPQQNGWVGEYRGIYKTLCG